MLIKTTVTPNDTYTKYSKVDATLTHTFNVEGSILNYKLVNQETDDIFYNMNISLEDIKDKPRFSSQSWVAFWEDLETNPGVGVNLSGEEQQDASFATWFPLITSLLTKRQKLNVQEEIILPFKIFIPSVSSTWDDCIIQVRTPEQGDIDFNVLFTVNGTSVTPAADDPTNPWKSYFSPITASTTQTVVEAGDNIVVNVQTSDPTIDFVYLEPVLGVLDRTTVKLTNGSGVFTIITNTLSAGDEVEVKLGYKYYTGLTKFVKTLS